MCSSQIRFDPKVIDHENVKIIKKPLIIILNQWEVPYSPHTTK